MLNGGIICKLLYTCRFIQLMMIKLRRITFVRFPPNINQQIFTRWVFDDFVLINMKFDALIIVFYISNCNSLFIIGIMLEMHIFFLLINLEQLVLYFSFWVWLWKILNLSKCDFP